MHKQASGIITVLVFALAGCANNEPVVSTIETPIVATNTPESENSLIVPSITALPHLPEPPLPEPYVGPIPDGAVQVLGRGETSISVSMDGKHYAIIDWYGAQVYDGYTLQPIWDEPQPGHKVVWMADGEHVAIDTVLYTIDGYEAVLQASPTSDNYTWSPDGHTLANDDFGIVTVHYRTLFAKHQDNI